MNVYNILIHFPSGENLKLKINDIDNFLSLFESPEKGKYKHTDTEGINYLVDLNKVEYVSYINSEQIEKEGEGLDNNLTKFL